MRVALRDDDTCYFTPPEALDRVYGALWEHVPVCLATVPFAMGYQRAGIPEAYWHSSEPFALERNGALLERLRELVRAGHATIALHGYTHQDYRGGFEFQVAPNLERRARHGRAYLEDLLDVPITTFVPPHNALSRRGLRAVSVAGLDILGSFLSFRPSQRPWDRRTARNWWRVRRFRRATGRTRRDPLVYPHVLRYARHAELGCHMLLPQTTLADLLRGFDEARAFGGDFCLATHHWEIDDRMADVMARFFDRVRREPDVRLVSVEEIFGRTGTRAPARSRTEAGKWS